MIVSKSNPDSEFIVAKALKEHQVVIIPTDTVYGFSGIVPFSDAAIRSIKGRSETKPFIQLISDPSEIEKYSSTKVPDNILQYMPGPLTVIVKNKQNDGTTAFRCPDDNWLRNLIKQCNAPLYSTSTNRSGEKILFDVMEMEKEFGKEVYCIVEDNATINKESSPSTIVDVSSGEIVVVRQGALRLEV